MKAVLLSIRPEWCEKILNGKKTVELRKSCPVHGTPFKVYIYCTMQREGWFRHPGSESWCGKVIGEFVCDKITGLTHVGATGSMEPYRLNILAPGMYYKPADELLKAACLSEAEAEKYLKGRDGIGWHISDLKIYDKPKSILDFHRAVDKTELWCEKCAIGGKKGTACAFCYGLDGLRIRRPPQSWCYVEELSNE